MTEIEKFIERVQKSVKAKSREIRLTMAEAQSLSNELAILLLKENKLLEKIVILKEKEDQVKEIVITGEVTMDGGGFKN